jgi:toxin ParE1/3/4
MVYDVKYIDDVEHDLFEIYLLIEDYAGPDVARAKLLSFERLFDRLAEFPHIGSIRDDLPPELRVIPAGGKGIVCFTVDDLRQSVMVICASYAGADWVSRVKKRHF